MSERLTGGPAFQAEMPKTQFIHYPGMTLRDYFAGQALVSLSSDSATLSMKIAADKIGLPLSAQFAACAYEVADAMLAEREK